MSIAIVVSELDIYGGTHKQVIRLCEYLKKEGKDYCLVTGVFDPTKTYREAVTLNILSLPKEHISKLPKLLRRLITQLKIFSLIPKDAKLVNIHDNRLTIVGLLSKITGKKVVWQINDLPPTFSVGNYNGIHSGFIKRLVFSSWYKFVSNKFDLITVNVSKNKERIKEILNLNAKVIYCGVDSFSDVYIEREMTNEINVLSSGVFFRYRNYESLIKSVALSNEKLRGEKLVTLDIIGSKKYEPEYALEIEELALSLGVKLNIHSNVPFDELSAIHRKANLFAFLNLDQSWGLSVFEAATYSLPIILSKSVGAVELLNKSNGTVVVDPIDIEAISEAICSVTSNQSSYCDYSLSAFLDCSTMTWDKMYCEPLIVEFNKLLIKKNEQHIKKKNH
ncbi:glycosyltransferase family 4 protein [Shewanella xiamenensis]|uniref:glycosyltransferase family 4 protein n=1 Tax=Shewanella xiamenensis TaxID=332186 RepID=UPI00313E8EB1